MTAARPGASASTSAAKKGVFPVHEPTCRMGSGDSAFPMATKMRPVMGPSWAGAAKDTSKRGSAASAIAAAAKNSRIRRKLFLMSDNDILFLAL